MQQQAKGAAKLYDSKKPVLQRWARSKPIPDVEVDASHDPSSPCGKTVAADYKIPQLKSQLWNLGFYNEDK